MENDPTRRPAIRRPALLTAACLLSFLGSGAGLFSYMMFSLSYQELMDAFREVSWELPGMELLMNASRGFFVTGFVLYAASFSGVLLMWRLKKPGFHLYLMAQILLVLQPYLYLDLPGFPFLQIAAAGIFIFVYGIHLKIMS